MRLAALASMVVMAPGAVRGCGESSPESIEVRYSLPDGPGDRGVTVIGCTDWDFDSEGPGTLEVEPGWARCSLVGWRRDGRLHVHTEPVRLDPEGVLQEIRFDLVSGPIGGMGTSIEAVGPGMLVREVVPGSPADGAGLHAGDLVVSVDGVSAADLHTSEFIRRATGPVGTTVEIEVNRNGAPFVATLVRERIP